MWKSKCGRKHGLYEIWMNYAYKGSPTSARGIKRIGGEAQ